jgi:hypothetical protein
MPNSLVSPGTPIEARRRTLREDRHPEKIRARADCAARHGRRGVSWPKSYVRRPNAAQRFETRYHENHSGHEQHQQCQYDQGKKRGPLH